MLIKLISNYMFVTGVLASDLSELLHLREEILVNRRVVCRLPQDAISLNYPGTRDTLRGLAACDRISSAAGNVRPALASVGSARSGWISGLDL